MDPRIVQQKLCYWEKGPRERDNKECQIKRLRIVTVNKFMGIRTIHATHTHTNVCLSGRKMYILTLISSLYFTLQREWEKSEPRFIRIVSFIFEWKATTKNDCVIFWGRLWAVSNSAGLSVFQSIIHRIVFWVYMVWRWAVCVRISIELIRIRNEIQQNTYIKNEISCHFMHQISSFLFRFIIVYSSC